MFCCMDVPNHVRIWVRRVLWSTPCLPLSARDRTTKGSSDMPVDRHTPADARRRGVACVAAVRPATPRTTYSYQGRPTYFVGRAAHTTRGLERGATVLLILSCAPPQIIMLAFSVSALALSTPIVEETFVRQSEVLSREATEALGKDGRRSNSDSALLCSRPVFATSV